MTAQARQGKRAEVTRARGRRPASAKRPTSGLDARERARVEGIQRARMLSAVSRVAAERGAANLTVAHVVERAGVSRRTFYELFTGAEDCLLAAMEQALVRAKECVFGDYDLKAPWRNRIRAALVALLRFCEEEPATARLLVVESLAAGPTIMERRRYALEPVIAAIDEGREPAKASSALPPLTAEGVVGGVLSVIHERVLAGERTPLVQLANPLMSMVVLPYLGAAAARRELDQPTPPLGESRKDVPLQVDPFKDAGMRLTYRTIRVLGVIGENPGLSNRQIGDTAGASDQGQISKLLARLQRMGLITNSSQGAPAQGMPNAWTLTPLGEQLAQSIQPNGRNE